MHQVIKKCGRIIKNYAQFINEKEGVAVMSWKDKGNKPTNVVHSFLDQSDVAVLKQRHYKGTRWEECIPFPIVLYNQGKGNVDTFDQGLSNVNPNRRNKSWRRAAFLAMLSITIVNLWAIYKYEKDPKKTVKQFTNEIKEEFAKPILTDKEKKTKW